jgi:CPA2 family monovalent cation:H+ antiporter-2
MVLGESDFRHQIEDDIRPFRDVLVGLFFVTIGMQIDLSIIIAASFAVLGWTLAFTLGKGALVALVARALRYPLQVALRVGITLAHGGEFGLLLLTQAVAAGVIGAGPGYAMLVALAFTMGLAPILIQRSAALADRAGITAVRAEEDAVGARQ